jgi:glycosyltransferase involved in cell wall biosynthesis
MCTQHLRNSSELTFAVGIPTYNNDQTIAKTLESLLSQTHPPDRIIIVDSSDDKTPDIVQKMSDASDIPIELIPQSDRGKGVGSARQDIYNELNEDILGCLDTQKRVDRDWVERRLEFHACNPEYDILSGAPIEGVDRSCDNIKDPYFLRQSNCSIRKGALDMVNGWDRQMARGEDWDLRIRLWMANAQAYAKSSLSCEFIQSDSRTSVLTKIFTRPSSISYLRKYGWWYLQFHPIHVFGDLSSLVSTIALFITIPLGFVSPVGALFTLSIPILGSVGYLYMKVFRNRRDVTEFRLGQLVIMLRFFILGITALRQLFISGNTNWKYDGFNSKE